jgi:RNA polymerase sigma factor (sigma-70 family)
MSENDDQVFADLQESRRRFLELVKDIRPELHRYCARMTGSVTDGEDIVQETLAKAYYELADLKELPALRGWLFRIAHNRAIDYTRRYERRMSEPLEAAADFLADDTLEPDSALARNEAVGAAFCRFLELSPMQRSCVILKDVFSYSLEEISGILELSKPAVKSALIRGRTRLREISRTSETAVTSATQSRSPSPALKRYADLFNTRNWEGVRALLVDDVRLDLVSRMKRSGRSEVGNYLSNYDRIPGWHLVPAWLDDREVLAVFANPLDRRASYFIELGAAGDRIATIRDFRYVPYVLQDATIRIAD